MASIDKNGSQGAHWRLDSRPTAALPLIKSAARPAGLRHNLHAAFKLPRSSLHGSSDGAGLRNWP